MKVRMKTSIAGNEFAFAGGAVLADGDGYSESTAPAELLAAWVEGGIAEVLEEQSAPEPKTEKKGKGK